MRGATKLPQLDVRAHQTLVGVLVAWLLGEELVAADDAAFGVACREAVVRQLVEHQQVLVAQLFSAQHGPVLVQIFDQAVVAVQRFGGSIFPGPRLEARLTLQAQSGVECAANASASTQTFSIGFRK